MSQGKRLISSQTAVRVISQRSFRASRTSNRLIAAAAIIVVILITATCSVFFNLQSFSALQDLKSYGTTTDVIFPVPAPNSWPGWRKTNRCGSRCTSPTSWDG